MPERTALTDEHPAPEPPRLDLFPWREPRSPGRHEERWREDLVFDPRPRYSQNREDYEEADHG